MFRTGLVLPSFVMLAVSALALSQVGSSWHSGPLTGYALPGTTGAEAYPVPDGRGSDHPPRMAYADRPETSQQPTSPPASSAPPLPPQEGTEQHPDVAGVPGPERDNKDDQDTLIETWVRHAMPGEEHKLLNQMAGPWKTKVRYRMSPDTPAVDSEGTATRRWVLGNRFLLEEFDGGNLGLPFQGLALYGYDTFEQKYTSVWVDTTSTAITRSLGSCQDHCTQILFTGEHGDAWSGTKKKTRGVVRLVSPTEHVLELHEPDATGSDFLVLSITYQRSETPPQVGPTRPPRP